MLSNEFRPALSPSSLVTNTSLWRTALWCGLLAGFGELVGLGIQKYVLHQMIYFGWHILWMAPLANACVFAVLGAFYWIARCFWRRLNNSTAVLRTFLFFVCLSWALLFPFLKFYAAVLLASGIAWHAGRRLAKLSAMVIRRSSYAMLLVTALFGFGLWRQQNQWQSAFATSAATKATKPNVLLIVLDTVRAQNLSVYGYARSTTPNLEKIASEGAKFERAFSTAPWTLPSHASMFTGHLPAEMSADFRTPLNTQFHTLAETLRANGYQTGGFVANTYYCNTENGLARGFDHYEDYTASPAEFLLSASLSRALIQRDTLRRLFNYHDVVGRKAATQINASFLSWLDQQHGKPFFAFLNYMDAHEPCLPPSHYAQKFGPPVEHQRFRSAHLLRTSWRLQRERVTPQQNQADLNCYDGAINYLDAQLGQLFAELGKRKLRENTLIIITADHGEEFGEHGHFGHVDSAYVTQLRVPLLMLWPGVIPAGQVINVPVSLRDLAATTLDLLKLEAALPGEPLNRHWQLNGSCEANTLHAEINIAPIFVRRYATGQRAIIQSFILGSYHFLRNPDGRLELYDYENDPAETQNLSEQIASFAETLEN